MKARTIGKLGSTIAGKSWATSVAVHLIAFSVLITWNGPAAAPPQLHSHFGQTSLLLSAADPNPGRPDPNDSLAEPSVVLLEAAEMPQPQPIPAPDPVEVVGETAIIAPTVPIDVLAESPQSLVPPQAALEPISQPQSVDAPPPAPPGDDTPTSSAPSPGRMGNDQPSNLAFDDNPPILYPPDAVRDGIEGSAILRIRIGVHGNVVGVELVKSSGSAILDRAAMEGVRTWHGQPAHIAGHAIEAAALLPVVFRLN